MFSGNILFQWSPEYFRHYGGTNIVKNITLLFTIFNLCGKLVGLAVSVINYLTNSQSNCTCHVKIIRNKIIHLGIFPSVRILHHVRLPIADYFYKEFGRIICIRLCFRLQWHLLRQCRDVGTYQVHFRYNFCTFHWFCRFL